MPDFIYEEMLRIRKPFKPTDDALNKLAEFMTKKRSRGKSKMPAGYTYLSQFIAHDIAFDKLGREAWGTSTTEIIENGRTPNFNLENVYGLKFPIVSTRLEANSNTRLRVGNTSSKLFPNDLPRKPGSKEADIEDERNDENLAVAQIHLAFLRFHNAIVKHRGKSDTVDTFLETRRIAIRHYQWIILNDFLPRIVKKEILEDVIKKEDHSYRPNINNVFMPSEFAFGAYRFGHSLVRDLYNWNRTFNINTNKKGASLYDLKKFTGSSCKLGFNCMEKLESLPSRWIINWKWFFDINGSMSNENRTFFNFAKKIETSISTSLGKLHPQPDTLHTFDKIYSLPARDLYRSRFVNLPTGQAIAERMDSTNVLSSQDLREILSGELNDTFSNETPAWFYFLAEAELNKNDVGEYGETLGNVGSRIVAEVFIELLKLSDFSILNKKDFPEPKDFLKHSDFIGEDTKFGMAEMLSFVEKIDGNFINPLN